MNTKIDLGISDTRLYKWGINKQKSKNINEQLLSFIILKTYENMNNIRKDYKDIGNGYEYVDNFEKIELLKNIKGFDGVLYELVFHIIYRTRVWIDDELGIIRIPKHTPLDQWVGIYIDEYRDRKEISCKIYDDSVLDKYSRYIFKIKDLNNLFIGLFQEFEKVSVYLDYYEEEQIGDRLKEKIDTIYYINHSYGSQKYSELFILSDNLDKDNRNGNVSIYDIYKEINYFLEDRMYSTFKNIKIKINDLVGAPDMNYEAELNRKIKKEKLNNKLSQYFSITLLLIPIVLLLVLLINKLYWG